MITSRISWIDVARGLGIILVIYAHGLSADSYRHLIYAFHMPLFFFLSGITFHHRKYEHFTHVIQKAFKGILLPYFIFAFLSYFLWYFDNNISGQEASRQFLSIFYGNSNNGRLIFNNVLWFLPCLFLTRIGFATLTHFSIRKEYLLGSLFLFSLAGYFFSIFYPKAKLFFGLETALTGIAFFGAGFLWHKYAHKTDKLFQKYAKPLFVFCLLLCVIFTMINFNLYGYQIDMRLNRLSNYFLFYLAAGSGILSFIALSKIISHNSVLEYLGKNSLILFVWHLIAFSYFNRILRKFVDTETIENLRNIVITPLYTILSIVVILSLSYIFNLCQGKIKNYLPARS